jgi:diguanylate cyclase (GGDEF)-like protein
LHAEAPAAPQARGKRMSESKHVDLLFDTFLEISSLMRAGGSKETILTQTLRCAHQVLGASLIHLLILEKDTVVRYILAEDEAGKLSITIESLEQRPGIVNWIVHEHTAALWGADGSGAIVPIPAVGWLRIPHDKSLITAPLSTRTRRLGIMMAFREAGAFNREDLKLLKVLAGQVAVAVENAELYKQIEEQAITDGLTRVFNYRYFMEVLGREIERAKRFQECLCLLMLDVDNLKTYNDAFGHLAGSRSLTELADLLRLAARSVDILAKYGGDEFSVILPHTEAEGAVQFARRVIEAVSTHTFEGDPRKRLTISMGIATFPQSAQDGMTLLKMADRALYQAKHNGKNRYAVIHNPVADPLYS